MNKKLVCTISFLVYTVAYLGCAGGSKSRVADSSSSFPGRYALQWKPVSSDANYTVSNFGLHKDVIFGIGEFTDVRDNRPLIGYALKNKMTGEYSAVETGTDIGNWCGKAIRSSLNILTLRTGDDPSAIYLDGEIQQLTSKEESAFHGAVTMRISARKGESMLIWEGMISGESNVPVYSYNSADCSKALSEAVINAVYNLLMETSFADAVAKSKGR